MTTAIIVLSIIGGYLFIGSRVSEAAVNLLSDRDFKTDKYVSSFDTNADAGKYTTGEIAFGALLVGLFWPVSFIWFTAARQNVRRRTVDRVTKENGL